MKLRKIVAAVLPVAALVAIILVPAISGAQNFGSVSLNTGFMPDPRMLSGTSGGGMSASAMGGGCRGWITPQPDHYMFLNTPFSWLRVFVRASGDTTLVVRGPMPSMATRCNDDRFGTNPAIDGAWAPGQYHVWVGSYSSGAMHPYQIGFTEITTVH
jgi:hypothetical protein